MADSIELRERRAPQLAFKPPADGNNGDLFLDVTSIMTDQSPHTPSEEEGNSNGEATAKPSST